MAQDGDAEVVLRPSPIERHALARTFFKGSSIGVDSLFQALGTTLPPPQPPKGDAEVVLRRSPIERHALARTLFKGSSIGIDSLFQTLGAALPLAQGLKGIAKVALRRRVLPPSSVATPRLNTGVSCPACVGERH